MPQWEIEVTDRYSGWGTAGKIYRPGVYLVDDPVVVEEAEKAEGIFVRQSKGGAAVAEQFPEPQAVGPVTREDILSGNAKEFSCDCGAGPYRTETGLAIHRRRAHKE